jgi:hypothetical protein
MNRRSGGRALPSIDEVGEAYSQLIIDQAWRFGWFCKRLAAQCKEYIKAYHPRFAWGLAAINGSILLVVGNSLFNLLTVLPSTCEASHYILETERLFMVFCFLAILGACLAMLGAMASMTFTGIWLFYTALMFIGITVSIHQDTPEKMQARWLHYVAVCRSPPGGIKAAP